MYTSCFIKLDFFFLGVFIINFHECNIRCKILKVYIYYTFKNLYVQKANYEGIAIFASQRSPPLLYIVWKFICSEYCYNTLISCNGCKHFFFKCMCTSYKNCLLLCLLSNVFTNIYNKLLFTFVKDVCILYFWVLLPFL